MLYNISVSVEPPSIKNCLWGKPVDGGFTLYWYCDGAWKPLKLADDMGTLAFNDDQAVSTAALQQALNTIMGSSSSSSEEDLSLSNIATKVNVIASGLKTLIENNALDVQLIPEPTFEPVSYTEYEYLPEGLVPKRVVGTITEEPTHTTP